MKLRVWYGLRKLTKKVVKKPAIIVVFENSWNWKHDDQVGKMMEILHVRYQTEQEMSDVSNFNRSLSIYEIYLQDKKYKGSPKLAIEYNSYLDRKQVSEEERAEIANKFRNRIYDFYKLKEPEVLQLAFDFE